MSLRRRMVVFTAAAVAFAVVLSAVACYVAVRSSMRGRLDHQLQAQAALIGAASSSGAFPIGRPRPRPRLTPAEVQLPRPSLQNQGDLALLSASGTLYKRPDDPTRFTVTPHDLAVARGKAKAYFRDGQVGGAAVRVYVAPAGNGRAVMAEQALTDLNSTLHDLAVILIAIAVAGVAIAGLLGLFVARAAAAPVHLLRQAAEHVRSTGDLSRRIRVKGTDDLGRLGQSFNDMLGALEDSQRAQRQLVADASHELRTPVATIRTNLEVLARNPDLHAEDRAPLLRDLIGESAELGGLVEDLLESARQSSDDEPFDTIALDAVVDLRARTLEQASSRIDDRPSPAADGDSRAGVPPATRARQPPRQRDQVEPARRTDRGDPQRRDAQRTRPRPRLRARRSPARLRPLLSRGVRARPSPARASGLSIVRKVAEEHGGVAQAANASDGGAIVSITFALLDGVIDDGTSTTVGAGHNPHPEHTR